MPRDIPGDISVYTSSSLIIKPYFFTITLHFADAPLFMMTLIVVFPFLRAFTTPLAFTRTIFLPMTL